MLLALAIATAWAPTAAEPLAITSYDVSHAAASGIGLWSHTEPGPNERTRRARAAATGVARAIEDAGLLGDQRKVPIPRRGRVAGAIPYGQGPGPGCHGRDAPTP